MKIKLLSILVCLTFLSLISCNKYLEVDPDNRALLNSPQSVRELVSTAYPQASYIMISESMSDNFSDKGIFDKSILNPVNRDVYLFKEVVQSNEEDSPDFYWAACYKAIAAANQALKYIEESGNPKELEPYKGEALVCRAYAHFMLGVFFARTYSDNSPESNPGIPYVKEVEDVVVKKYERGTVKSMYENIQSDLEDGIPLIDDDSFANSEAIAYHFNKRAAYAFATRFYLFKKDYDQVIKYSKLLFPSDAIVTASIRDIVSYKPMPYLVLQAAWTSTKEPSNLLLGTAASRFDEFPSFRFGANGAFATGFMWKKSPIGGTNYGWNLYGVENFYNIPKFRSYENLEKRHNVNVLFSGDEVLFNWAEASIMKGDFEQARKLFNLYLKKKLVSDSGNEIPELTESGIKEYFSTATNSDRTDYYISAALDFKRREFAFEGLRWLDMIRHRIPIQHNSVELGADLIIGANDPRRILQIPLEVEMSGVERNPR